jgi:hypothetical protein
MDVKRISSLVLCGLAWAFVDLPSAAQNNSWKKEIDNAVVRVLRRLVPPGKTVPLAELPPGLVIFLTDYSVRVPGAAPQEELRGKRSHFLWHSGGKIGLENLSGHPLEIAHIAPKFSPELPYQLPAVNARDVEFDNDLIRMRRIVPRALERAAGRLHHVATSVLIELSAAHFRLTHADGRVEEIRVNAGDIWFQPGDAFTVESLGAWPEHEALRIELKTSKRNGN